MQQNCSSLKEFRRLFIKQYVRKCNKMQQNCSSLEEFRRLFIKQYVRKCYKTNTL